MTSIDIGAIVIILFFTVRGAWIGLVRQLAFIAALLLAFLVAGAFSRPLSAFLKPLDASPQVNFLVVYGLLLVTVYVAVRLLGLGLSKMMKVTMLGGADRVLGGVFGLAKGTFLATLLFMAVAGIMSESAEFLRRSVTYPFLSTSAKVLSWCIRDQDLRERLRPKEPAIPGLLDKAKELIPEKVKEAVTPAAPPPAAPGTSRPAGPAKAPEGTRR